MTTEVMANNSVKEITFEAVVIRADGTREDLGVIAHWEQRSFWRRVKDFLFRRNPNLGTITSPLKD